MAGGGRKQDSFNHSPFKTLKGLPVSGRGPRPPVWSDDPPPAVPQGDDPTLFSREMEWLDVRPLPDGEGDADRSPTPSAKVAAPVEPDDAGVFLEAVGRLDKTFRDALPEAAAAPRARPRRIRQLERGALRPDGELDLHGLHRDEALRKTRTFLAHAVRQGWEVVIIVTGKGLHSNEGPVLRQAVERLLDTVRELVLEWGEAPRRYGGGGALAVFLRVPVRPRGEPGTEKRA